MGDILSDLMSYKLAIHKWILTAAYLCNIFKILTKVKYYRALSTSSTITESSASNDLPSSVISTKERLEPATMHKKSET